MKLTVLGNGSGGPVQGRHYTMQVLQVENDCFLIDCGEACQQQLYRYKVRYDRFNQIFISHLHGDHVFGLAGLLTSYSLKKRDTPLLVFSPPGLRELIETTFRITGVRLSYPLEFHEVDADRHALVFENKRVEVWSIPLNHRTPCAGWLFRQKPKLLNLRKEKIEEYAIPYQHLPGIKHGADLVLPDGRTVPNAELTHPPKPLRSYAFCSDTAYSDRVAETVRGVSLLYHEATFSNEHREEATVAYHSTAEQAAWVARQAGVERLLLGHFSGRYTTLEQHVAEARAVFAESYVAEEGETYAV